MSKLNLSKVQVSCLIKGCTTAQDGMPLDRHHRRSQKMFVRAFEYRASRKYRYFKARYERFEEADLSRVCRAHHELIHDIYYVIVRDHKIKLRLPLRFFSWKQAEILMNELEAAFWQYVKKEEARLKSPAARQVKINPHHPVYATQDLRHIR